MSDDEREPPSDPFGSPESEPGERGMTHFGATAWALLSTAGFIFMGGLLVTLRRPSDVDLTTLVGVQVVVTLLVLFFILRFYAPDISIRRFLGVRNTHVGFYPMAAALGALVHVPANALLDFITKYFPTNPEIERSIYDDLYAGRSRRIAATIALVLIGPAIEEVFYRGALFRPLRKNYEPWSVILVTSILFALAHQQWQQMIPIALLGAALGLLRSASGSLFPSIVMHGTFNGITLWAMLVRGPAAADAPENIPWHIAIGGTLFTFVLMGLVHLLGERSDAARAARIEDEV